MNEGKIKALPNILLIRVMLVESAGLWVKSDMNECGGAKGRGEKKGVEV